MDRAGLRGADGRRGPFRMATPVRAPRSRDRHALRFCRESGRAHRRAGYHGGGGAARSQRAQRHGRVPHHGPQPNGAGAERRGGRGRPGFRQPRATHRAAARIPWNGAYPAPYRRAPRTWAKPAVRGAGASAPVGGERDPAGWRRPAGPAPAHARDCRRGAAGRIYTGDWPGGGASGAPAAIPAR